MIIINFIYIPESLTIYIVRESYFFPSFSSTSAASASRGETGAAICFPQLGGGGGPPNLSQQYPLAVANKTTNHKHTKITEKLITIRIFLN